MVQSSMANYSRRVRLSDGGLEERPVFGRRRAPLEEIGKVEFQDVGMQLEELKPRQARSLTGVRGVPLWVVKDRGGRDVLRLAAGMTPAGDFRAMREEIERGLRK